ncbi:MAG: type II toxin-antitoxin system VapC family toxin [Spirochaetia bacterium]|nr:type II toxin-antitoxin system VapC family toxin [Spirochaetia bacterium]
MVVFIDTSALAKRYIEEVGSKEVDFYFQDENDILLAPVTTIEMKSVFTRRLREKSILLDIVKAASSEWEKEEPSFRSIPFNSTLRNAAIKVIERTGIKTLDSIQLASADLSSVDIFITADKALSRAAEIVLDIKVICIGSKALS